jgi:hypothetical protein
MYPSTPIEEYRIDVLRYPALAMFSDVYVYIRIFPNDITFELWIDGSNQFLYRATRKHLL